MKVQNEWSDVKEWEKIGADRWVLATDRDVGISDRVHLLPLFGEEER